MTANGRNATLKAEAGTLFNPFVVFAACREFKLVLGFVDQLGGQAFGLEGRGHIARLIQAAGLGQLLLLALKTTLVRDKLHALAKENSPGDDRRQNQTDHHNLHHDVGMMIHTPDGEIRLHQIITHSVSPGHKSQNLSIIISKQHRIDSSSH